VSHKRPFQCPDLVPYGTRLLLPNAKDSSGSNTNHGMKIKSRKKSLTTIKKKTVRSRLLSKYKTIKNMQNFLRALQNYSTIDR